MKIGILTVPFNNNYGGYLQAYALMTVLKRMGHEPTMIMRRHNPRSVPLIYRIKFFVSGIIKTFRYQKKYPLIYNVETNFRFRGKKMLEFVDKHITPQTIYIYSTKDLKRICKDKFDAYIVGSDQVWRAIYVPGIVGNMFLDFTEGWNVKRIAYAASFGTDKPEYFNDEKSLCGRLLENFDSVSVRETSGINVIKRFDWKAKNLQTVLDPTMLLSAEDYNYILPQKASLAKGKIFCYILDKTIGNNKFVETIVKKTGRTIYEIADIQNGNTVLPPIEDWLTAIRDADFIITDSFHGTVFSIIFNKPFLVCANKKRGYARFYDLLSKFNLDCNIADGKDNLSKILATDWNEVNILLEKEKNKSRQYLYEISHSSGLE